MSLPGFTSRITKGGIFVRRYHYSADARKRPGTADGDLWVHEEALAYPLGTSDPRWFKEMDIKYGALGGQFIFPQWELWKKTGSIITNPFDPVGYTLYGAFDYGFNNPSAYLVIGASPDATYTALWEFYGDHVPAHAIAKIIKGQGITLDDGRQFEGNPFAGREEWIVADPSIWNEDVPQFKGPNKSTAQIFRENDIHMQEGERGGDITVANWLLGYYWADPLTPRVRISNRCTKLIWELGNLRNKEFSEIVDLKKNRSEELQDKDNHAWDALKYFLKRFPPPPVEAAPPTRPNTFQWWRQGGKPQNKGNYRVGGSRDRTTPKRTYRIGS